MLGKPSISQPNAIVMLAGLSQMVGKPKHFPTKSITKLILEVAVAWKMVNHPPTIWLAISEMVGKWLTIFQPNVAER